MTTKRKILAIQSIIIIFLWLLLFMLPMLFESDDNSIRSTIPRIYLEYGWILILFLINRFLLMPYLFFRKRQIAYFLSIGLLLVIFSSVVYLSRNDRRDMQQERVHRELRRTPPRKVQPPAIPPYANFIILSILIIGFDMGLNISMRWMLSEQQRNKLEKENSEVKLALLHNQISPHFFMNMLNNIHALVDIDKERSKESIIRLSKLMSYLLYETNTERVPLANEVEFIGNYVNLMRLRYPRRVEIDTHFSDNLQNVDIPPLLFLNFIENAFKYGVSYKDESFIKIDIEQQERNIVVNILNTNHSKAAKQKDYGLGIANSRNRLNLLYGSNYKLTIKDESKIYHVNLSIPI